MSCLPGPQCGSEHHRNKSTNWCGDKHGRERMCLHLVASWRATRPLIGFFTACYLLNIKKSNQQNPLSRRHARSVVPFRFVDPIAESLESASGNRGGCKVSMRLAVRERPTTSLEMAQPGSIAEVFWSDAQTATAAVKKNAHRLFKPAPPFRSTQRIARGSHNTTPPATPPARSDQERCVEGSLLSGPHQAGV